jgi:alpha-1,2-mannosyltransferase
LAVRDRTWPETAVGSVGRWGTLVVALVVGATIVMSQAGNVWGSFRELGLLDVQIYRMGGEAIVRRTSLYHVGYAHDGLLFTYSPFAAVVFVPLFLAGWSGAAIAVTVASAGALVRSCVLLLRGLERDSTFPRMRWSSALLGLVLFGLAIWPTRSTFEYGQVNVVLMWLVIEDFLGAGRRARWGGVLIGLAAAVKLTPAFFILFAVASGQYRRALNASLVMVASLALGFVVLPAESWEYWTSLIFDPARVGSPLYEANQSIYGLVSRFMGHPAGIGVQLVGGLVVGGAVLVTARSLWVSGCRVSAIAAAALGPLLLSPISWSHHWVWMTVFLAVLAQRVEAGHVILRAARVVLMACLMVVSLPRLLNFVPSAQDRERGITLGMQLLGSVYVYFGLALLAYLYGYARSRPPAELPPSPGPGSEPGQLRVGGAPDRPSRTPISAK